MTKKNMRIGVTSKIRRHISGLKQDEPFTTRELITYGSRRAIDNCIFRLVEGGEIHRLARGVFVKIRANGSHKKFTIEEIAHIKANSFGRKLHTHPFKKAKELAVIMGLIRPHEKWKGETQEIETTFEISGPSSSFIYEGKRIYFKRTTRRKIQLEDSKAGLLARALWYNGIRASEMLRTENAQRLVMAGLNYKDREELLQSAALIPAWLNEIINRENETRYVLRRPMLVA